MAEMEQEKRIDKGEDRNVAVNQNAPEVLTNPIYTPAFLREQIGRLMRVEFLIGTNNMTDRIGILEDVGASYILLRSFENDSLVYCDIYAIKFITISTTGVYGTMNNFQNMGGTMNGGPMMRGPMMYWFCPFGTGSFWYNVPLGPGLFGAKIFANNNK